LQLYNDQWLSQAGAGIDLRSSCSAFSATTTVKVNVDDLFRQDVESKSLPNLRAHVLDDADPSCCCSAVVAVNADNFRCSYDIDSNGFTINCCTQDPCAHVTLFAFLGI
jgi:hypothetical protein